MWVQLSDQRKIVDKVLFLDALGGNYVKCAAFMVNTFIFVDIVCGIKSALR
jgi:hypothetical protein